jgi:hypothetical protein
MRSPCTEIVPSTIFVRFGPCDFWLFPKLKTALKGHRFSDIDDIQGHSKTILKNIPEEEFQKCFEQWKHRIISVLVRKETTAKVTAIISV